jgi:hypothetical protein
MLRRSIHDVTRHGRNEMSIATRRYGGDAGPKQKKKHYSYNENVDEPAKLIDKETVEIERAVPMDENESTEQIEKSDKSMPQTFEE